MRPLFISLLAFLCIFGGALAGFFVRKFLPSHHLSPESKAAVKLGSGLIATMAGLILGMLIYEGKGNFDQISNLVNQGAANYVHLDTVLKHYGSETTPIRSELRSHLEFNLRKFWPEECGGLTPPTGYAPKDMEDIIQPLSLLNASTLPRQEIQKRALLLADSIYHEGKLAEANIASRMPWLLIAIPVLWITLLTFIYGLLSPWNATVVAVLCACSLGVAAAVFLICAMNGPMSQPIKVSGAPLRKALEMMSR